MNPNLLVSLLITTVVAIIGWMVAHRLTVKRDLVNKRRELRVEYLIEAYRRLERAGNRRDLSKYSAELESALADIQFFGTPEQVEKAQGFAVDFAQNQAASLDELLFDLRETLRVELQLEPVKSRLKHLGID